MSNTPFVAWPYGLPNVTVNETDDLPGPLGVTVCAREKGGRLRHYVQFGFLMLAGLGLGILTIANWEWFPEVKVEKEVNWDASGFT